MDGKMKNRSVYHWLVLAACCGMAVSSLGIVNNCIGVFYLPVSEALGVGRGSVALFSTIVNLCTAFGAPVAIRLIKKFPIKPVLLTGALLIAGGLGLLSLAESVWVFYVVAPFVGFGCAATSNVAILTILSSWFEKSYGMASGLALSFSGIGGALMAPVFTSLISSAGWRASYLVAAGVAAVASIPGIILVIRKSPQEKGYLPYGGTQSSALPQEAGQEKNGLTSRDLLSVTFISVCLMGFLSAGVIGMNSHLPGYAQELGFTASVGAMMVTCCMVGNILSKLLLGVLCDTLGAVKGLFIMYCSVIGAALIFLLIPSGSYLPYLAGAALYGAAFSIGAMGQSQVVRRVYPPEKFASVFASASIFNTLGVAVMNSAFGFIYDFSGSYTGSLVTALCMETAGAALMLAVTRKKR